MLTAEVLVYTVWTGISDGLVHTSQPEPAQFLQVLRETHPVHWRPDLCWFGWCPASSSSLLSLNLVGGGVTDDVPTPSGPALFYHMWVNLETVLAPACSSSLLPESSSWSPFFIAAAGSYFHPTTGETLALLPTSAIFGLELMSVSREQ